MKGLGNRLLMTVVPFFAALLIRLLRVSMRAEILGEASLRSVWDRGEKVILSFWHDQTALMVGGYRGPGAKLLISVSKDGELLARTMAHFGFGTIRGSSTRGGRGAFRQMVVASRTFDVVLTPDGPKGPRHQVKPGVVQLARLSGRPVVPMAFACSRGHRFNSWDRFLFPYPFSRGVYSFGGPLTPGEGEDPEAFRKRLESEMENNEMRARKRLEEYGVSAV